MFDTLACVTGPSGLCGENPPQELADRIHALWVALRPRRQPAVARISTATTRQVYPARAGEAVHEPPMPAAPFLPLSGPSDRPSVLTIGITGKAIR